MLALLAGAEAVREGSTSDDQAQAETGSNAPGGSSSASPVGGGADDEVRPTVPSQIIDAPSSRRPTARPASKATTTTTRPSAATSTTAVPAAGRPGAPGPAPAVPATAVPPTAAPRPAPPATAPPTTAPPPPAAPTVQSFTATPASAPGGACGALQWATTLSWSTTNATAVTITGLLEPTLSALPGDGTRVVCRALPTPPIGGWALRATGPGGTATASA